MTFRPTDDEFILECHSQPSCAACPIREGCIIRYSFYQMNEQQLLNALSKVEARLSKSSAEANVAHRVSELIRGKYAEEHKMHPRFSYK